MRAAYCSQIEDYWAHQKLLQKKINRWDSINRIYKRANDSFFESMKKSSIYDRVFFYF